MHKRFAGARTAKLRCPGGTVEVVLAEGSRLRLLGLMRLNAEAVRPLLFPRCRSLHTFWMKTPIDVVWLDLELEDPGGTGRVLRVEDSVARRSTTKAPGRIDSEARRRMGALELLPGQAEALGLAANATVSFGEFKGRRAWVAGSE